MHVTVRGVRDLQDYFGKESQVVELPENARLLDLLDQIEMIWGSKLPAYQWDSEKHQFKGPIFLVIHRKVLQDLEAPLQNGMEIHIIRAIAGGHSIVT